MIPSIELPPMDEEGKLIHITEAILQVRVKKLRSKAIFEYLIKLKKLPLEDAKFEGEEILKHPSLQMLEDKISLGGENYNVLNSSHEA